MPSSSWRALVAALITTSGCSGLLPCGSDDLSFRATPTSASLAVGQKFTASGEFLGCRGSNTLSDEIRWSSQDTTVVRIDAVTGTAVAVAPGATGVIGTGARYGAGPRIPVTVTR